LALAIATLCLAVNASAKTKTKVKSESRSETFSFASIDTLVIYNVRAEVVKPQSRADGWRWNPKIEIPSDSASHELSYEMARAIRRRDSTIAVHILPSHDSSNTDSTAIERAQDSLAADAVLFAVAIEARTEASSPGVVLPGLGGGTFTSRGHGAKATAKIRFELHDTHTGEVVWTVTCEAKHEAGGGGFFDFDGSPPPPVETAMGAAYMASMAKLPF
jgi:hypothetical protein